MTVGNAAYFIGSDSNDPRLAAAVADGRDGDWNAARQVARDDGRPAAAVGGRQAHRRREPALFRGRSVEGWELWGSDGTADGTAAVKDINPGPDSGHPVPGYTAFSTATAPSYFVAGGGRALRRHFATPAPSCGPATAPPPEPPASPT